ncbi:hypothetical protein BH09PSE6_BH09PSE6_00550 [soil metagenome]
MTSAQLKAGLAIGALLVFAGCGGGGGNDDNTPAPGTSGMTIPESATASVDAFIAYVKAVTMASSETADPVVLGNATAPVSDTADATGL